MAAHEKTVADRKTIAHSSVHVVVSGLGLGLGALRAHIYAIWEGEI